MAQKAGAKKGSEGEAKTSWGGVSEWYDGYLEGGKDTYQEKVLVPNLLRILNLKKGDKLIDIACGQGYFARKFAETDARVTGADISKELILQAQGRSEHISYRTAPAHDLSFALDEEFDVATIVLAIQNIEPLAETFLEAARVLKPGGRLVLVLNHPAFRIPKRSSWGWDDALGAQYRRLDGYLSASVEKIEMHPGKARSEKTVSYHRSLQDFSKALFKAGFSIARLEEWISHKKSEKGPRQHAEDKARKEIPLFLMIEARKMNVLS